MHPAEHAAAAVELLVARLAGDESTRARSVRATLRVRASTRPQDGMLKAPQASSV